MVRDIDIPISEWPRCANMLFTESNFVGLPVSLLLVAMIYTGSKSLQFLTVSMFTVFKNVAIVLIAFAEWKFFGNEVTSMMLVSFLLIVCSHA
jgi:multidrug transporter EmrE-like cation transporter